MKNRSKVFFMFAAMLTGFLFCSAAMAETCTVGTFPIPLMVESKDKGVFIDLTKEVARRAGIEIAIQVAPPLRTLQSFGQKKIDCIFPGLDVTMPGKFARSSTVSIKRDFSFYQKGKNLATIQDLEGKKVGITRGYPYAKALTENKTIRFDPINSDVTNMKKLSAGRLDAFVVEEKSGLKALEQAGATNIEYNKEQPISEQDVYYAFQDTERGRAMAKKFSEALEQMKKDGTFGKIMSKAK